MSGAAIVFERASKVYRGGVRALDGVSFAIERGVRACLLGPNGAGKSTAIRLLQGAIGTTEGRVFLLGEEAGTPRYVDARRRTGIVPQGPGMYPDLTAGEYLEVCRRLFRAADAARVIDVFGLGGFLRTRMSQLSGGFQRRLVMAGALLGSPEVLLLDEPTVGLDPVATHEVHGFLADAMGGRTTLLCTHNLAEAERLCDDVVILDRGRVLLHRPLTELRREARPRLRIAARQGVEAVCEVLRRRGLVPTRDGDAAVLVFDDPRAEAAPLLRSLLAQGLDVCECTPLEASLETMFLEALGR